MTPLSSKPKRKLPMLRSPLRICTSIKKEMDDLEVPTMGRPAQCCWAAWAQVTVHINHSTKENSPGQFFSCGVRSHSNGAVSVWMLCYLGKFSPVNDILFSRRKQQNKKISSHYRITTLISKASPLQAASQSLFSSSNNPLQNDNLAFFCIKSVVSSLYQVLLTRRHVLKDG